MSIRPARFPTGAATTWESENTVKKIAILLALLASPAHAQQAPAPTAEQVRDEANGLIAAVRQQRDQANDQLAQAMAQNAKLTRDLKASDEALDAKDDDR